MTTCRWLGLDMSALGLVASIPEVSVQASRQLADNTKQIQLVNRREAFNTSAEPCILRNAAWIGSEIEVVDDHGTIVSGRVSDGMLASGIFTVTVQSFFRRYFSEKLDHAVYSSDPATAILSLIRSTGMPDDILDIESFESASRLLADLGVLCHAVCLAQYNVPLIDAINALLSMGSLVAWMDDRLHVGYPPKPITHPATLCQRITTRNQIGFVETSNTENRVTRYSLGYLGDSGGSLPAEGGETEADQVWAEQYNATSMFQFVSATSAHAAGQLRLELDAPRRTATVRVREDGGLPILMGAAYAIDGVSWGGAPGWLAGYTRKNGVITLSMQEVV